MIPGIVGFALGLTVIVIAWLTWPKKSAPEAPQNKDFFSKTKLRSQIAAHIFAVK
jgi:hypothetical protein